MSGIFCDAADQFEVASTVLHTAFDAGYDTPQLIDKIAEEVPQIREVMASLRTSLPLVPHSGVGPIGRFYRLPNHYRSVSFLLSPGAGDGGQVPGAIVFKGTEPLLSDFPRYFDWMLNTPFRSSSLPLGLHFPLDMKLPPAAMWIEECMAEQAVSSKIQQEYLRKYGQLARLPLPLFVFRMTPEQVSRYEDCVCSRISAEAFRNFRNKVKDGLGVEVYYYPELPVRVADLFVGNVRETFKACLVPEQIESTFSSWARLLSEILCLGYMPYVPWHHGMGGCVDPGNVCIDGGFNDLLTLVPFHAIPDDVLFHRSLQMSIQMLAESMTKMSAASIGLPSVIESDAMTVAANYLRDRLGGHIKAIARQGHAVDARLTLFFESPAALDILDLLRTTHRDKGKLAQFVHQEIPDLSAQRAPIRAAAGG